MKIPFLCLLLSFALGAQGVSGAAPQASFSPVLGTDPHSEIHLFYHGCWDGLLLGAIARGPAQAARRGTPEATVEVWDIAFQESPRESTFRLFLGDLRQRLIKALQAPPASYGQEDLAILSGCIASQGNAAGVDMAMVQSLQDRFNRLPPPKPRP